jgi:hypothetical protein
MDILFATPLVLIVILALLGLSATLGVDSREGFADDRFRQPYR